MPDNQWFELKDMNEDLIAPCGMNCGRCNGYLAYSKGISKKRDSRGTSLTYKLDMIVYF
jgi:hypothetical protein